MLLFAAGFVVGLTVCWLLGRALGIVRVEHHYTGRTIVIRDTDQTDFDAPPPKTDWRHEIADLITPPSAPSKERLRAFDKAEAIIERLKQTTKER